MKKKFGSLGLALALMFGLCVPAKAASPKVLALKIGSNQMVQGSQVYQVDSKNAGVTPIIENGRTLVPASQIVKMFGGASHWLPEQKAAAFQLGDRTAIVIIGKVYCSVNGELDLIDVAPKIINSRTYVPLRAVLEGLGLTVKYEASNRIIVVSDGALNSNNLLSLPEVQTLIQVSSGGSGQTAKPSGKQIAPAVTLSSVTKSYDTSSRSSVYIPDLSAATGGIINAKEAPGSNDPNAATYSIGYPRDPDEIAQAAQEYYELLASLPYLQVVEPLNEKWGFYRCSFQYTGSGSVKKNTQKSLSGDICDLYFYLEKGSRDLHLWFAQGFQIVDTGHRLSLGKGSTVQKAAGARLTEAYTLSNGVYRNAGDGKLAAKSGQCSLLVNGNSYTGTVQFHTENSKEAWATDKFTISGFKRTDWIELAFPMDYAESGDVYTSENFQRYQEYPYGTTNKGAHWAFAVSADNGSNFVMPMANNRNVFDYSTVRVLQWDKSGDTVLYFSAKLVLNGQNYDVEGLLAAPNTVTSQQPSGGSSGEGDCWYCGGSGTCPTCGGSGRVSNWMPGTQHTFLDQNCTDCYSPGKCRMCGGSGRG